MFDTHAVARALTEADLTPAQADAITDAVRLAAEHDAAAIDVETLATKSDVAGVKSDLAAVEAAMKSDIAAFGSSLKSDIAAFGSSLKSDIAAFGSSLKSDVAGVKSDMASLEARMSARISEQETRLIKWMVGVGVGVAGLVVAALRLFGQGVAP